VDREEELAGFPGESDGGSGLETSVGPGRLKLGRELRVSRSAALNAELDGVLGQAIVSRLAEVDAGEPAALAASGA